MKNLLKAFGVIALAAIIGFSFAACGGDDGGNGVATPPTPSMVYESKDSDGNVYKLEIKDASASRAAYTPQPGDTYVLTITFTAGGTKKSSGTVGISGNTLTLKPSINPEATITITVTETATNVLITKIEGTITFEDGTEQEAPATVIPVKTYELFNLYANRGGFDHWVDVLRLADFTSVIPEKGKKYTFTVSGTPNKDLNDFRLAITCQPEDWSEYTTLGDWEEEDGVHHFDKLARGVTFNDTFTLKIYNDPTPGWFIWLEIMNTAEIPASTPEYATMATIRNFRISLDKVE